ncbi:hypothetical protein SKAU_G00162030 [Synaphobranchus kaupii]|uniref:Uncharacterized protein n=1 Tax=Synaphobranchus kaupii TaxID=118154 RepID=A0A9Q1FIP4_SYNKA|nr:hypothetical protein SKAU_G00162030 [Synaphobranchus kaupii]
MKLKVWAGVGGDRLGPHGAGRSDAFASRVSHHTQEAGQERPLPCPLMVSFSQRFVPTLPGRACLNLFLFEAWGDGPVSPPTGRQSHSALADSCTEQDRGESRAHIKTVSQGGSTDAGGRQGAHRRPLSGPLRRVIHGPDPELSFS